MRIVRILQGEMQILQGLGTGPKNPFGIGVEGIGFYGAAQLAVAALAPSGDRC